MNTLELIEELVKKPKAEVGFAILQMMIKRKIDFKQLSEAYVQFLELQKDDMENKLTESNTCVMESFMHKVVKEDDENPNHMKHHDWVSTQRRLYCLNQSRQFQMNTLNEKYHYDEEKAKEFSWYERDKRMEENSWKR